MFLIARGRILVTLLTIVWVCLTGWFEYFRFIHDGSQCQWPDHEFLDSTREHKPHHVLVIADPQILDHRSYPDRGFWLSLLTRVIVKINMRKNWMVASGKKPDSVVFLGDMLDGGRFDMPESEYESYVALFHRIFKLDPSIPKYYIPGNHDTGLGTESWFSPERYERYKAHFGELNYHIKVANHTLLFIDAPGFAEEENRMGQANQDFNTWKPTPGGAVEFVTNFKQADKDPVILMSHIPLYRPDGNGCGHLRERGWIRPGGGVGYQNTLAKDGTQKLLQKFHPTLILSGDDHDYCEYDHFVPSDEEHPVSPNAREVSVKSLSMAMGIKRPGFQLLSLAPYHLRNPSRNYKPNNDAPCFLPDQIGIYLRIYLPAFVFTVALIFMSNLCCWRSGKRSRHRLMRSEDGGSTWDRRRSSPPPLTRRGGGGDAASYLPSPVSAGSLEKGFNKPLPAGQRSLKHTLLFCFYPRATRHSSFVNCLLDIRDVAMYPVAIFVVVSYWFS